MDLEGLAEKVERLSQRVSGGDASLAGLRRDIHDLRGGMARVAKGTGRGTMPDATDEFQSTIQEQLGAVADQLEALDEVANRVTDLGNRVAALEAGRGPMGSSLKNSIMTTPQTTTAASSPAIKDASTRFDVPKSHQTRGGMQDRSE